VTDTPLYRALRYQAASCADLGSPFMARLLRLVAARLTPGTPLTDRLFGWEGEIGPQGASVPLRLAGALHALKLEGEPRLAAVYPPATADEEALWHAVSDVLADRAEEIGAIVDSPPQTNEVRRATAVLAALTWLGARHPGPVTLSELGASAGLNLLADRFAVATPTGTLGATDPVLTLTPAWRGGVPDGPAPLVVARRGCDIRPLDPVQDRRRILSYLWPDQAERLALTEAALGAAASQPPGAEPALDRADAGAWLRARLWAPWTGLHLVYHTIAWQYFPPDTQTMATEALEAAGSRTHAGCPLAWLAMEADGQTPGAALTLRLWPGGATHRLGRIDYHGRWIDWQAPAL